MGEKLADTDGEKFVKFSLYFLGMQQQPRQSAAAVTTGNEEAWEEGEGVLPHREPADEQNLQLGLRLATSCGVFFFFADLARLQRWRGSKLWRWRGISRGTENLTL